MTTKSLDTPEALAFRDEFNAKYRAPHDRFVAAANKAKYIEAVDWSTDVASKFEEYWKNPYQYDLDNMISFDIQIENDKFDQDTLDIIIEVCTKEIGFEPDSWHDQYATCNLTYWHMEETDYDMGNYDAMTELVECIEAEIADRLGK